MGVGMNCLYTCAPLTAIASVLLFMMAYMLGSGNWTFEVLAAKNGWSQVEKSRCCRNGAVIYLCLTAVLWTLVLLDSFVIALDKVPGFVGVLWRQKRLPSWRELMRNRRKANARAATPAVDVVLTSSPAMVVAAAQSGQGNASPSPSSFTVTVAESVPPAAQPSSPPQAAASSPLLGAAQPVSRGGANNHQGRHATLSGNTSATTSLAEADHLLD